MIFSSNFFWFSLLLIFVNSCYGFNSHDSTIYTYWRNGYAKTSSVFKVKKKIVNGKEVALLKKRKTTYYDLEGEEMSKSAFNFFYKSNNEIDYSKYLRDSLDIVAGIQEKIKALKSEEIHNRYDTTKKETSLILKTKILESHVPIPLTFTNDDHIFYKEKDTIINKIRYPIMVLSLDTNWTNNRNDISKYNFIGAIRVQEDKAYYFDNLNHIEHIAIAFQPIVDSYLISCFNKKIHNKSFFYSPKTPDIIQVLNAVNWVNNNGGKDLSKAINNLIKLFR